MENVCFELSGKMYTLPPPSVCVRVILDFDKPGGDRFPGFWSVFIFVCACVCNRQK